MSATSHQADIFDDEDDYDDDFSGDETYDPEEYRPLAERILELSPIYLGPDERAHCERWTEDDFRPTMAQIEYLERLFATKEREEHLRGGAL